MVQQDRLFLRGPKRVLFGFGDVDFPLRRPCWTLCKYLQVVSNGQQSLPTREAAVFHEFERLTPSCLLRPVSSLDKVFFVTNCEKVLPISN